MTMAAHLRRVPMFFAVAILVSLAGTQLALAQTNYQIGSSNTVTADPAVLRPATTPCKVQLFDNLAFEDFNPKSFQFTPPPDCPGPWLKIVFEGDFSVTEGIQFDRTANVWVGGTNIYFGTTAEPSPTLSPSWHVERDLTDYAPLFEIPQSGQADIGNLVNDQYTGIIYGSADIEFYPYAQPGPHNPRPFDEVYPLSAGPDGGTVTLSSPTDTLSATFTLPMNVQKAYLDVIAQSQNADEFWYTCVPSDVSSELQSCPNTAYRETEVSIDGQPAGVAPVFPWIYTGGIDPYLWFPLPATQTLDFTPYRLDLTPFAGLLSNGQPHTVSLSEFNVDNYFSTTATLLILNDQTTDQVTGEVTQNTLSATPSPVVTENLNTDNGNVTGTVAVNSTRAFIISGYIEDGNGRTNTTLNQNITFSNSQNFDITAAEYSQDITQSTTVSATSTQSDSSGATVSTITQRYPLTLNYLFVPNSDGTYTQTTTVHQEYHTEEADKVHDVPTFSNVHNGSAYSTDALQFDANFNLIGNSGQASFNHYFQNNSLGGCYDLTLDAANNALTSINYKCGQPATAKKKSKK